MSAVGTGPHRVRLDQLQVTHRDQWVALHSAANRRGGGESTQ